MKFSARRSAVVIAALAMAATGALSLNQTKADAATVATVNSGTTARLYTNQGKLITNRALSPNSPWAVGEIITINGAKYYQVATNEYLKASDSTLNNGATNTNGNAVGTIVNGDAPIYYTTTKGEMPAARNLANGSQWQVTRAIRDNTGTTYYEVAPNQWISSNNMSVNKSIEPQNIENKFIGITNNKNADQTDQNQSQTPDVSAVEAAIFQSINDERATKGIAALTQNSALTNTAEIRAKELSTKFDHVRPNGQTCFTAFPSGGGTEEENIAEGYTGTASEIASKIMDSFRAENFTPSHYTNVMSSDVTTVGVGVYQDGNGTYFFAIR
ncbi:CAP domain-containing protein [Companilactobacillus halodurans]|uniref:SCP domain-containing protein n=1 Tax=Companilactobacillus halodurans TaxID=2584183 RepID=A0A5P0ZMC7_9LACO|nr:CAP domain-containing protein [Companilactobacillus halodurans]MQS75336.1 hypothetical protein [Companilactobacillus halodurans]MQS97413.1 hypothetical protein [Companilactobacillus halodurans]